MITHAHTHRGLYKIARPSLIPSERGALLKRFGSPWKACKLAASGYSVVC